MPITVTVLDTAGIQPFIFGSNVLRENIGASELVYRATRLWVFQTLDEMRIAHNINMAAARTDDVQEMYVHTFEAGPDPAGAPPEGAEVLYAGGGNTVILFQGEKPQDTACEFVYRLSLRLLSDAPGLNLYAIHRDYPWGGETSLPKTVDEALKELGRSKGRDLGSLPALGFPVTAACTSTGLPANDRHPDEKGKPRAASRANKQVWQKWTRADLAGDRLRDLFPRVAEARFEWTDDFNTLAALPKRDDSYVAVVHADGNGMGARIKALTEHWSTMPKEPRGYITAMRALSNEVQTTAVSALQRTLNALVGHLAVYDWPRNNQEEPRQHHRDEDGKHYFPVRPIVFGGDDVTLVCAGPWGLAVAQRYLVELEKEQLTAAEGDHPYACAGVAIVKTHYPFSQAYDLSEELTKLAKGRAKRLAEKKASALDWHVTTTGLHGDLETIRRREYTVEDGVLTMRPLMLDQGLSWRNWANLRGLLTVFGEDGNWQEKRNKTMRLREALRRGPHTVAEFWTIFGDDEGEVIRQSGFEPVGAPVNGWVTPGDEDLREDEKARSRCAYFDAIEIADQCFELPPTREGA